MRRALLISWALLFSLLAPAQDFASLFVEEYKTDSSFTRVTISPKMMEEILKSDTGKNENVLEIISDLKSMQLVSTHADGETYYRKALEIVEKNPKRFQPFLSYESKDENFQIRVRKKGGAIVELIMLMVDENHFVIINFTGKIKPEFISALAESITLKHS